VTEAPRPAARRRVRARVEGVVQGVGFRPYVFRLAHTLGLGGFVFNDARGVVLEVEGEDAAVERFLERLAADAPPLAIIERVFQEEVAVAGEQDFAIVDSAIGGASGTLVSPDIATCDDCLRELFDPSDRRFRYPFINCTCCGPRFTIVRGVPYDRPLTTMAGFAMCGPCHAEYDDPTDRRFHAQPNACPVCGPRVRLTDAAGAPVPFADRDALEAAARAIAGGAIVAVKGIGGFHLACRADDDAAVASLRSRKHREEKPFAVMVPDLVWARGLADLVLEEETLLASRVRPVVLCRRQPTAPVAVAVAPRSANLGLLLPYSPLHHLLLADAGIPLVMTSGNVSDEPIAYDDAEAIARLSGIADLFLLHDRPIETRTDDSVVRVRGARRPMVIRRSRGYVPASVDLPVEAPPLLACGAELKSTFCLAKGRRAWVGHHIGDLKNYETLQSFRDGIGHFERLFAVTPELVAHDLHPDYLSTSYALERQGVATLAVQHHHAHLAACLAEHGESGPAIGAIFDGSGYGADGTVWGGELLIGGLDGFERAGHLWPVRLPGGDQAVREPWRMACAWLSEATGREPKLPAALGSSVEPGRWRAVAGLTRGGMGAPLTTSMGRLFDAVAALCGIRPRVSYEGQAAAELEALAQGDGTGYHPFRLIIRPPAGDLAPALLLDPRETVLALARDLAADVPLGVVAARFHEALADATVQACSILAERRDVKLVVLSGGVFQNVRLLECAAGGLAERGLRVLTPVRLPPNDGGIAYGQAAVAASSRNRE